MIIGVIGTENFYNNEIVEQTLSEYTIKHLITGVSKGINEMAYRFAFKKAIPCTRYNKKWRLFKQSSSYEQIIKSSDELVFFWDSKCKEVKQAIDKSIEENKKFRLVDLKNGNSILYN